MKEDTAGFSTLLKVKGPGARHVTRASSLENGKVPVMMERREGWAVEEESPEILF